MSDIETEPKPTPHVPTGSDYVSDRDFVDFPISPETLRGIHGLGYKTATAVQAAAIEPGLAGKDLIVRAKTGTGKTAAYCIPLIERIEDGERITRAIVLAPTRELAQQIAEECRGLAAYRDLTFAVLVGGMPMPPQIKALREGAEIVVGTPGRVLDHLRRGNLDLSHVRMASLDEADEMLSMGFYEDVTSIVDACPDDRQLMLHSATISHDTQRLITRYAQEPEEIYLSTDADQVEGIEHVIYETNAGFHKARALLYLLDMEDPNSAIIFCNTREDAAMVAAFLDRQGLDVQLLSGELPQGQRNRVMNKVKRGEVRFLASTDVASRGIDISDLSHVINYALPQDPSLYLHRIGRTGRIGKQGTAISLVGATDLNTRRMLEGVHGIEFTVKEFPDPETCVQMRVERQAQQIRNALGTMAFEAYLPTVRALIQREDGEALLAATLRAFFQWDRVRRAKMSDVDSLGALDQAREEKRERRKKGPRPPRPPRRQQRTESSDLDALLVTGDAPKSPSRKRKKGGKRSKDKKGDTGMEDLDAFLSIE
ncbi:MAG: DEAD/DEAH box helicase [Deltaproteobacteria bacterium]|nr:DEAD/DEAH box helicase [Deltaproteobacteria bacterium]MBW2253812.1 DEAD/DEAH box helicase [Deltaproteobacteria bacterium]